MYSYSDFILELVPDPDFTSLTTYNVNGSLVRDSIIWHCNRGIYDHEKFKPLIEQYLAPTCVHYVRLFIPDPEIVVSSLGCESIIKGEFLCEDWCMCNRVMLYIFGVDIGIPIKNIIRLEHYFATLKLNNNHTLDVLKWFFEYHHNTSQTVKLFFKMPEKYHLPVAISMYEKHRNNIPVEILDVYHKPGNPGFEEALEKLKKLGIEHQIPTE